MLRRLADGVDPEVITTAEAAAVSVPGVVCGRPSTTAADGTKVLRRGVDRP